MALAQALRRKGQEASVYVAMRYWKPFTEDAIEQARLTSRPLGFRSSKSRLLRQPDLRICQRAQFRLARVNRSLVPKLALALNLIAAPAFASNSA